MATTMTTSANDDDDNDKNDSENESIASSTSSPPPSSQSLFLSSDERYEVLIVKLAERPHLLAFEKPMERPDVGEGDDDDDDNQQSNNNNDEQQQQQQQHQQQHVEYDGCSCESQQRDDSIIDEMALIDGCDIPGWRQHGLIPTSHDQECILGIGSGSVLLRRESQLPVTMMMIADKEDSSQQQQQQTTFSTNRNEWQELRQKLLKPPPASFAADCIDIHSASELVIVHHNDDDNEKTTDSTMTTETTTTTMTRFAATWEVDNRPCVITGCCCCCCDSDDHDDHHWNMASWSFDSLVDRFADLNWRFSDTHGAVMSLGTYAKYVSSLEGLVDDSPLAIYDSEFGDATSPTHVLTHDYQVPKCFSPDLFDLAITTTTTTRKSSSDDSGTYDNSQDDGDAETSQSSNSSVASTEERQPPQDIASPTHHRPPYRWILMGPARSGTGMHIDPLHTNAWVTVVQGLKRWMLFPPQTPPDWIGMQHDPPLSSVIWFRDYYAKVTSDDWPKCYAPIEVLQVPGTTVFVPNGWPHVVVNLQSMTVAVTHNYASEYGRHFSTMVQQTHDDEPEFYQAWIQGLKRHRPDLYQRIITTTTTTTTAIQHEQQKQKQPECS